MNVNRKRPRYPERKPYRWYKDESPRPVRLRCKDKVQAKDVSNYLLSRHVSHILAVSVENDTWGIHLLEKSGRQAQRIVRELRENGVI